jgi:hypothetical protein
MSDDRLHRPVDPCTIRLRDRDRQLDELGEKLRAEVVAERIAVLLELRDRRAVRDADVRRDDVAVEPEMNTQWWSSAAR